MNNKFLFLIIGVLLIFMVVNGFTYQQSFNVVENTVSGIYDAVDRVSGLFGVLSDRTENLVYLFPSSLGHLSLEDNDIDISSYVRDHMVPYWLPDIPDQYSVSVYASPVSYSIVADTRSGRPHDFNGYVCFQSSNCIRLRIVIKGIDYYSEHNILACMGNFYFSRNSSDNVYGLYYFSFDKGTGYFDVGTSYSSFEDFLADSNDVTSIIYGFPSADINYPYNHIQYTEGSQKLEDTFLEFYNYLERE